jgi:hypothetical protein
MQTVEIRRLQEDPWDDFVFQQKNPRTGERVMVNGRYIVHVSEPTVQTDGWPPVIHLSIRHITNVAITDFRDFQRIKNELVSPKAEAMQIFPAESRLIDSCNQYHLWVFCPMEPGGDWPEIPVGYFYGRDVSGPEKARQFNGNQRPFDEE